MSSDSARALTPKGVAAQLGLCTRTVLNYIRCECIKPVYRLNARVNRIPQHAVDDYLAQGQVVPPKDSQPLHDPGERRIAV